MALHTVAFMETAQFPPRITVEPVQDEVFRVAGTEDSRGFLPREDGLLVAAVAGGAIVEEDATLSAAQVFTPSMEITPANIHPLNVFPWPSPTGALYTGKHPPRLRGQEAFVAKVENSTAAQVAVIVWVCNRIDPAPEGENFLLGFSASAAPTPGSWTKATTFTWGVPYLPVGRYHILGMEAHSTDGGIVAARLLLPGQIYRPGTVVLANPRMLPPPFLMDGCMGSWGYFDQRTPLQIEVLGFGDDPLTVNGFLRVVRVVREQDSSGRAGSTGMTWG